MNQNKPFKLVVATLALSLTVSASVAESATPNTGSGVSLQPSETSEVFGNWTVRCFVGQGKAKGRKACETSISVTAKPSKRPIAKFAISQGKSPGIFIVGVLLPVNVGFPSVVSLANADKKQLATLAWTRCMPGACLAAHTVKRQAIEVWEKQSKPMLLTFVTASKKTFTIPISTRGMTQSIAALAKE